MAINLSPTMIISIMFGGFLSFIILLLLFMFFGRLIWLQLRIWFLAKRGFVEIDHVREDNVINTYYMRPSDDHFEFDKGIYILQKDALSKRAILLKKVNPDLLSKSDAVSESAESKEFEDFKKMSKEWNYAIDAVTLKWGIPTIFYYGNDPNPHNFRDRTKIYDSKVMAAVIHRIALENEWKLVRLTLILSMIALGISIITGIFYLLSVNAVNGSLNQCLMLNNQSQQKIFEFLNLTGRAMQQSNINIV